MAETSHAAAERERIKRYVASRREGLNCESDPYERGKEAAYLSVLQHLADPVSECPSRAVLGDGYAPCDLPRKHDGPHSWEYPNLNPRFVPWDAKEEPHDRPSA